MSGHGAPFAANSIDTEQIYNDAIIAAKIAANAVETDKIKDLNVTSGKLAAGILTNGTRQCLAYASVPCTANATVPIGTIPGGSLVEDVIVVANVAINGNGTEDIGDAGDADGLLATANITKTLNAVSGEDPATRGAYLWVPGVQDTLVQTTTPSDWDLSALHVDDVTHNMDTNTQGSTAGDYTVTASPVVTTYAHPRKKWYESDTVVNATITKGTNTTGNIYVYIFYVRGVMSG